MRLRLMAATVWRSVISCMSAIMLNVVLPENSMSLRLETRGHLPVARRSQPQPEYLRRPPSRIHRIRGAAILCKQSGPRRGSTAQRAMSTLAIIGLELEAETGRLRNNLGPRPPCSSPGS